jgi:NAD(P)H-dependent FMN reductase
MPSEQSAAARVLAISGSLQARSTNTALVQLARKLASPAVSIEVFDALDSLPYFNPEIDLDPAPAAVRQLRERIAAADGVLLACPEYAHEMPGVLKNALDWLVSSGEMYSKPVAVLCAAPSPERGTYVRKALAQTLGAEGAHVVFSATVSVPASERGKEPSSDVRDAVRSALDALVARIPMPTS